jgi:protoporphyrinogen oxidase
MSRQIDIVGAGITGLTTAWLLLKEGLRVRIHEAREEEAGLAACFLSEGFRFDYGPHEFCTDNPALVSILEELCGDDLMVIQKRVAQYFGGRLVPFPFRPADILKGLPPGRAARAIAEVASLQLRGLWEEPDDDNFETWTRSRFGSTLWREYFGPYTEKVWGVPPSQLDADVARRRISVDSAAELLRKMISHRLGRGQRDPAAHSAFRADFHYLRRGVGTLAQHLRRAVEELGGEFHFGRKMEAAESNSAGDRIQRLHFRDGNSSIAIDVETLVSTIPLPLLAKTLLADGAEPLLREHPLPFRGMVFAFLRLARPAFLGHHWVYLPDAEIPFQRLTEFSAFRAEMEPKDHCGLALEIASNPGEDWWKRDDVEIKAACVSGLRQLAPLADEEILGIDIVRRTGVYPLQIRGFAQHTEAVLAALRGRRNLITLGRQGLFRYCNMNECMEMAIDVAPKISAGEDFISCDTEGSWRGVALEPST